MSRTINNLIRLIDQRVNNGMVLLNSKTPDWRRWIDVIHLDMYSISHDTLGQIYGSYQIGLIALQLDDATLTQVINLGFVVEFDYCNCNLECEDIGALLQETGSETFEDLYHELLKASWINEVRKGLL